MKKTILSLIIVVISLHTVYSQSDFRPGYVILTSGDTLHGLIDLQGKRSRPHRCIFKENDQAPEQVFLPENALAYCFTDGKYYTSRIITIDGENIPLFLEHLFNGVVDVFYFRGLAGDNYLIESNDTIYQLRIVKEVVKHYNNRTPSTETYRTYMKFNKEYKDVLKKIFAESPDVVDKVNKVNLNHNDLIEICKIYHTAMCTDEKPYIIYEKRLPFVVAKYGPVMGLGINRMTVNINSPFYTFNNSFNHPVIPALGFFLSLNFPAIMNQHANIIIEGLYFQRELQAPENEYYYITLSQHVWQSSFMGRYRFPGSGLRPTLQGGFIFQNFIKNSFYRKFGFNFDMNDDSNLVVNRVNLFQNYHAGLSVGAGLASGKWSVDLRYNYGIVFGNRADVNTQAFQLNVGYSLN